MHRKTNFGIAWCFSILSAVLLWVTGCPSADPGATEWDPCGNVNCGDRICNPSNGNCVECLYDSDCDGGFCTDSEGGDQICVACVHDSCYDGDPCTQDSCDPDIGCEFIPIASAACASDHDLDGVPDAVDLCPDTPAGGTIVDSSGCACFELDSDGDGVNDCDEVANTHFVIDDPASEIAEIITTSDGYTIAALAERDSTGDPVSVIGIIAIGPDDIPLTIRLGPDGLPESVVMGDVVAFLDQYTDTTVWVTVVSPDGTRTVYPNTVITPEYFEQLRELASEGVAGPTDTALKGVQGKLSSSGYKLQSSTLWKIAGIALGAVKCGVGVSAFGTGIGAFAIAWTVTGCISTLIQFGALVFNKDTGAISALNFNLNLVLCAGAVSDPKDFISCGQAFTYVKAQIAQSQERVEEARSAFDGVPDSDGDGIANEQDNCSAVWNPDQGDNNANGIGDACETAAGSTVELVAVQSTFIWFWREDFVAALDPGTADRLILAEDRSDYGTCDVFLQFPDISGYRDRVIEKAEIVLTLYNDADLQDGYTYINTRFWLPVSPWSESTLSERPVTPFQGDGNNDQHYMQYQATPLAEVTWDITNAFVTSIGASSAGERAYVLDRWVNDPGNNFGIGIMAVWNWIHTDNDWVVREFRTFYSTRSAYPPRLRLQFAD